MPRAISSFILAPSSLRRAVGGLFVATGAFKMALWPRFFAFSGALAEQALAQAPPQVLLAGRAALWAVALVVPPLEVACGVLLWRGKYLRPAALLLALDMAGAILTVGVPGRAGRAIEAGGARIGAESWRLPLEVLLLLACAGIAARPGRASE